MGEYRTLGDAEISIKNIKAAINYYIYSAGEAPLGGQGGAIAPPILIVGGHCPPSPIQKLVTLYHYMKKRIDTLEHFNQSFCMMYYSLKIRFHRSVPISNILPPQPQVCGASSVVGVGVGS